MWQNPHDRVQTSPRIINVAVPAAQHSPMFGHLALWQTVCNFCSLTRFSSLAYPAPLGIFIFSHAGLRPADGDAAGAPAARMLRETDALIRASIKCREPHQGEQIAQLCGRRGRGG